MLQFMNQILNTSIDHYHKVMWKNRVIIFWSMQTTVSDHICSCITFFCKTLNACCNLWIRFLNTSIDHYHKVMWKNRVIIFWSMQTTVSDHICSCITFLENMEYKTGHKQLHLNGRSAGFTVFFKKIPWDSSPKFGKPISVKKQGSARLVHL